MYTATEISAAFQLPWRACRRRCNRTANTATISEITTMPKNSAVRAPIVSGLPTEGGLGGYLRNGTIATVTKPNKPSNADVPRARKAPIRAYEKANTSENRPPSAVPNTQTPVSKPSPACVPRLKLDVVGGIVLMPGRGFRFLV